MKNMKQLFLFVLFMLFIGIGNVFANTSADMSDVREAIIDILDKQKPQQTNSPVAEAKDETVFKLNFKGAPIREVVTELARQAGISVIFSEIEEEDAIAPVTISYTGKNFEQALNAVMKSGNLAYTTSNGVYTISSFEAKTYDIAVMFETSFSYGGSSSVSSSTTTSTGSTSSSSGSSGDSTVSISSSEFSGMLSKVTDKIRPLLSPKGKMTFLPSGVLYIKDYPNILKDVDALLQADIQKKKEISLKIEIMRVDLKDNMSMGVDWGLVMRNFEFAGIKSVEISNPFTKMMPADGIFGSIVFKDGSGAKKALIEALSSYGDVKIVHSWQTRAIAGTILPFELTQTAWYTEGNTIQVIDTQSITTPKISSRDVGIRIRLLPVFNKEGNFLVNTFVEMSNIVGIQDVAGQTFPSIEKNMAHVPIKLGQGETATISGFKVRSENKKNVGLPLLNQIPILRTLFGYSENDNHTSEMIVVVSMN